MESRSRIGDWEIHTVHGATKAGVVTIVERHSGLVRIGKHWEIDTVHGKGLESILTLGDPKSGYVQIGRLEQRTVPFTNQRLGKLIDAIRTATKLSPRTTAASSTVTNKSNRVAQ